MTLEPCEFDGTMASWGLWRGGGNEEGEMNSSLGWLAGFTAAVVVALLPGYREEILSALGVWFLVWIAHNVEDIRRELRKRK